MADSSTTHMLQGFLDRLRAGDLTARDELINHACNRLVAITRKMLGRYSRLRAWEQTDDVAQNAMLRLRRALEEVHPATVREFIGLASVQIRRELMDMTRHYFGREQHVEGGQIPPDRISPRAPRLFGQAGAADDSQQPAAAQPADETYNPGDLAIWREFHDQVQALPDVEREAVELLWYQELSQEEAAELLGVDKSTVKRRWRAARMKLHSALKGWLPGAESPSDE